MAPNKFIIERQVAEFRADNGLSASEAINLKSLLLKLNVLTIFRPLSDSRGRQHFTIAHELYHLYIESKPTPHKCNPCSGSKDPVEQSADMFASSLLMPETGLCQLIPENELKTKKISLATVLKLEHYFSVSRSALLYRLLNVGLLTNAARLALADEPVKHSALCFGYDTALYDPANEGLVIGDFGEKARSLFEQEKISEGHYWELLRKINTHATEEDENNTGC